MINIKTKMNKQIKIILWIVILLLLIWAVKTQIYITKLNKQNIELKNNKTTLEKKLNTKSKIELIQQQIKETKVDIEKYKKETDETFKIAYEKKKISDSAVWYKNCLEIEWKLEILSMTWKIECLPYYIESTWLTSEEQYKNLEKYNSNNLYNINIELGL